MSSTLPLPVVVEEDLRSSRTWHDRPVVGPAVYALSAFTAGLLGYSFGYLLTDSTLCGLYVLLFLDVLVVLYLAESWRSTREGG